MKRGIGYECGMKSEHVYVPLGKMGRGVMLNNNAVDEYHRVCDWVS